MKLSLLESDWEYGNWLELTHSEDVERAEN